MFLQGFINEALEPMVEHVFLVGNEGPIPIEAVLDTGFNGMLCLPRQFQSLCEFSALGLETFELADGTWVEEVLYVGQLLVDDEEYSVELTLTDAGRALIGMEFILGRVAVFNLKAMRIEVD